MRYAVVLVAACSSSAPPPAAPTPVAPPDAAPDAASPDAGVAADAPAWIFRYHTDTRTETWTLRYSDGRAAIDVASASGTIHYAGTITDALAVDVSTSSAKLHLDCKKTARHLSQKCNDAKGPSVDALDCYHPDFKEPMPFGPSPGIEFVQDASCTGYRTIK